MKTLEQHKEDFAIENGWKFGWSEFAFKNNRNSVKIELAMDEVAKRYATETVKEAIEICDAHCDDGCFDKEGAIANIKESLLKE